MKLFACMGMLATHANLYTNTEIWNNEGNGVMTMKALTITVDS